MSARRLFNWLIALTVAAGLLSAPFAVPAVAKSAAAGEMHAMAGDMHAMADDMPCCPDEGKAKDCDSCPLLALCLLTMSPPLAPAAFAVVPDASARRAFAIPDDLILDGLGARPPDHPPRTNA